MFSPYINFWSLAVPHIELVKEKISGILNKSAIEQKKQNSRKKDTIYEMVAGYYNWLVGDKSGSRINSQLSHTDSLLYQCDLPVVNLLNFQGS